MSTILQNRGLIVSCQALPDEPLHGGDTMVKMALAAKEAGAIGIRANGEKDIFEIKNATDLPVIGIIKRIIPGSAIFITPTLEEVDKVITAGADLIALDVTNRENRLENVEPLIERIHQANRLVVADVSTFEEGLMAESLGADYIATTLSGYTPYSPQQENPDFTLISKLFNRIKKPIIAEGRIKTPEDAVNALKAGAQNIVVGSAITRPQLIASNFVSAISKLSYLEK